LVKINKDNYNLKAKEKLLAPCSMLLMTLNLKIFDFSIKFYVLYNK